MQLGKSFHAVCILITDGEKLAFLKKVRWNDPQAGILFARGNHLYTTEVR